MAEPPDLDVSKVVVKDTPNFGRSAFAAVDIAAGELVLAEDPIISFTPTNSDAVVEGVLGLIKQQQQADPKHEASRIHEEDWRSAVGLYLAFCRAPKEVQQKVLGEMQGTAQPGMEAASPVIRTRIESSMLASLAPEITKMLETEAAKSSKKAASEGANAPAAIDDAAVIQFILMATEINVHSAGNAGAINYLGSKFTHTCGSPNTYYQSFKGRCCHVALKDIAAGDLLTTSYIPSAITMMSTVARQAFLRGRFAFQCACERCCLQVDKLCALPCQHCATGDAKRSEEGDLPINLLINSSSAGSKPAATGLLHWDPTKAAPFNPASLQSSHEHHDGCCGHDHDHDHDHGHHHSDPAAAAAAAAAAEAAQFKPWRCSKCAVELPDVDLETVGDFPVIRRAHNKLVDWAYMMATQFNPEEDDGKLKRLLEVLGPFHWSVHFCFNTQTDLWKGWLHQICGMIQAASTSLSEDATRGLHSALQGIEINQRRTWTWLTRWCGMAPDAAAELMYEVLALNACALLKTSAHIAAKLHGGAFRQLAANMKQLGLELLEKAEPGLAQLRCWKPCQHPLITEVDKALQALAASKGGGREAPVAAVAAPLDVQSLMDFLPAAPAGNKAGSKPSGGSKGKAKKGGKKK